MKILITGVAGFIGSHLADYFVEKKEEVIGIDNFITGRRENFQHLFNEPNFTFIEGDITDVQSLEKISEVDTILHFASPASPKDYLAYPIMTLKTGSLGTLQLLELALRHRAILVYASTSEVYGDPLVHPQREDYWGNVNPVGPRSVYDESKRFAESLITAYHRHYGLPIRIARIFNTYGPRMRFDDGRVVPNLLNQAQRNEPLTIYGDGTQTRSFCYISDMIEGIVRLQKTEIFEPVNLGNPNEFRIIDFARLILEITGSKSPIKFLPLPEDDPKRRCPDISKARKYLNWEPKVNINEGLKLTYEWIKENYG